MKQLISTTALFLSVLFAGAQSDSIPGTKELKVIYARIETINGEKISGEITAFDTNRIYVIKTPAKLKSKNISEAFSGPISYDRMQTVTIKRKNSALRGALIGFGIGAATGVIIGLAGGSDPVYPDIPVNQDPLGSIIVSINNAFAMTAGEKALYGGLGLGSAGAITGAIIGAIAKKKFILGGNKENSRNLQADLMRRLVTK